jgi:asparagine synthase (glutamine-hydrolysing)
MSGIAGMWHRDGRPVEPAVLNRLRAELSMRGPDGGGVWQGGSVGIAHLALHALPESDDSPQPLVDDATNSVLSLDGRIDNRAELAAALADAGCPVRTSSDAEHVLRACQAWGEAAPARLIGDFAFSYWDGKARRLICARDIRGARPFYYRADGSRLAWASELHALVRSPFEMPSPNEGFIAEHLANLLNSTYETVYAGVFRLPPASVLVATADSVRISRYWAIDPRREIRYRDDSSFDEHYLDVVRQAVWCRMRARGPIGVMLSGGLDSSVIAAMAAQRTAGDRDRLHAFSLSYPGRSCDERVFIDDVVRKWELRPTVTENPDVNPYEADVRMYGDLPSYPSSADAAPLFERARALGVRVLFTGLGGDEWFSGHASHYADLVRRARFGRLWQGVRADLRAQNFNGWWHSTWNTVRPMLPDHILRAARRVARHSPLPPWIRPSFATRVDLLDRVYRAPRRFGFPTHAQNELYREATAGFVVHGYEMLNRAVTTHELEVTHPLDDRRVIEFALAIPEEQRWRDGRRKAIVRRAAAAFLPDSVRTRNSDLDYDHPYRVALARLNARERLARPGALFDEWIDRRMLLEHFDRAMATPGSNTWPIWMALAVRLWADDVVERRLASDTLHRLAPQVA